MVTRRLIKKKTVRPEPRRHVQAVPSGLISGIIYSIAATLAIALGFVFYRNVQRARSGAVSDEALSPDLPPNVKVVSRRDLQRQAVVVSSASREAASSSQVSAPATALELPAPVEHVSGSEAVGTAETSLAAAAESAPLVSMMVPRAVSWKPELGSLVQTETVQLFPLADTAVLVSQRGEVNAGAATNLPIRGNEAFLLARYDTAPVRGWTIMRATWVARIANGDRARLGFSAIATPWQEGSGLLEGRASNGATFAWADFGKTRWRDDELPFSYMIRGHGGAPFCLGAPLAPEPAAAAAAPATDGWVRISVDPAVVQALVAGRAHGLAISDELGQLGETWWVPSREAGKDSHYLWVEGARADILPPGGVKHIRVAEYSLLKRTSATAAILQWTATGDDSDRGQAFGYDVRWGPLPCTFDTARPLPFFVTPFPRPAGQAEQVLVDDLLPDTTYAFFVCAVDEVGQAGPVAQINYHTPTAAPFPDVVEPALFAADAIRVLNGRLGLQVLDELATLSPAARDAGDAPRSLVWDRNTRTIRLRAARNETIGFVIQLSRIGTNDVPIVHLTLEPWKHPKQSLDAAASFYRVWFSRSATGSDKAGWTADALLPLADGVLDIRRPDNRLALAARHFVWTEVRAPGDAQPGKYVSRLIIRDQEGAAMDAVNVVLEILPIEMTADPSFVVELSVPPVLAALYKRSPENLADVAALERAYHEIAQEHRCVLAIVGGDGKGWVPELAGRGADLRVTSWDAWDVHIHAQKAAHASCSDRIGHVADHVTLPFSLNWPIYWRDGFVCYDKLAKSRAGFEVFVGDDTDVSGCMSPDFWMSWRRALQAFREHVPSMDMGNTVYHIKFTSQAGPTAQQPPWNLGAPSYRADFVALEAFGRMVYSEAQQWGDDRRLVMRANVGEAALLPFVQPGVFGVLCVSGTVSAVWDICRARSIVTGESFWYRSPATAPEAGPAEIAGVILRTAMLGASGWAIEEALGRNEDWVRAAPRSLIYCGAPFNSDKPFPSLRLKAVRRAWQDLAYLRLLEKREGWTPEQSREFLRREIPSLNRPDGGVVARELQMFRVKAQDLLMR